jgi:hypothetical protein
MSPQQVEYQRLESETRTWLIVGAIGWFVGFMWITGPLTWYQSSQIRNGYQRIGAHVPENVNTLRLLGIVTTVISVVLTLVVVGVVFFSIGIAVLAHR